MPRATSCRPRRRWPNGSASTATRCATRWPRWCRTGWCARGAGRGRLWQRRPPTNLKAAGRRPAKRILHIETRAATAGEAQALQLATGDPVCACHGLSLADGQPIAVYESVFPITRLPGIDVALTEETGVSAALARVGVADFTRTGTRMKAVRADATQALHLHLREGDPLLRTTGVNVDARGVPVEYGRTCFAGDRVTLTVEG